MKITYLMIDLGAILIPFLFSFHPRIKFYQTWKAFLPALLGAASPFLVWDVLYTKWGVWGFNPDYLIGIKIFGLPVEEFLFFICIPYACVFSYHCLEVTGVKDFFQKLEPYISRALMGGMIIGAGIYSQHLYTVVTFTAFACTTALLMFVFKVNWLSRFYFAYLLLLIPFFVVDGLLTGTGLESPIVWYNEAEYMGIRLLSIPFEDTFYGMLLIMVNVALFEWLKEKLNIKVKPPVREKMTAI